MRKATSILATITLFTLASTNQDFPQYQDNQSKEIKEIDSNEFQKEKDFSLQRSEDEKVESEFEKDRSQNINNKFQKETEVENERDDKRSKKISRKHDDQKQKVYSQKEEALRTGENKFDFANKENEMAEKNSNVGREKQANFHHEEVEEKQHIISEKDGNKGEKVKSQKWIKRREQKKGIKQKEGEGRNLKFIKNKDLTSNKIKSRKIGNDKRAGINANRQDTFTNIREKEIENESNNKRKENREENNHFDKSEQFKVKNSHSDSKNEKVKVEKDLSKKNVETKQININKINRPNEKEEVQNVKQVVVDENVDKKTDIEKNDDVQENKKIEVVDANEDKEWDTKNRLPIWNIHHNDHYHNINEERRQPNYFEGHNDFYKH